jgi:two-component system sensor histidine kinase KdpD
MTYPPERALERGKLKIFLGFAAGVGKTYQMLEEAQELRKNGVDVVIGYFEPHGRKETIALTEHLETVPRKRVAYRGATFEEMDTEAVLARRPAVCLVDEFPHTNAPGSKRDKRWEDVLMLLDAGIDVLTTMNIQHLESLNDQVFQISGVRVRETIPDWVMELASEVVMVDLTPRALLNRLERGVVYSPEKAKHALNKFFRESTLVALREMALRQTAHEVGMRHGEAELERVSLRSPDRTPVRSNEKILVLVTSDPASVALIRRAKRVADFILADCIAVAVARPADQSNSASGIVEKHLNFARNLHVETRLLPGESVPHAIVQFARTNGVTQIFLNWPNRIRWLPPFFRNDIQKLVSLARDMQVTIVDDRRDISDAASKTHA